MKVWAILALAVAGAGALVFVGYAENRRVAADAAEYAAMCRDYEAELSRLDRGAGSINPDLRRPYELLVERCRSAEGQERQRPFG